MKPAESVPINLAETQIPRSSADTGRDRKIVLTSLLLTGSLVAFVVTSLPQILSLPALEASPRFPAPVTQPQTKTLITISPTADSKTVNLSFSLSSASDVRVDQVIVEPASWSERDRYTVQVVFQPSASQVALIQK